MSKSRGGVVIKGLFIFVSRMLKYFAVKNVDLVRFSGPKSALGSTWLIYYDRKSGATVSQTGETDFILVQNQ